MTDSSEQMPTRDGETVDYTPGPSHEPAPHEAPPIGPSVLRALRARSDSVVGVRIESPEGEDSIPVADSPEGRSSIRVGERYEVVGELGRGGVGVVYRGRDFDLGRDVAMKVLRQEYASRPELLARFVEEAQIGGQLQHPGIVPVYELGLGESGQPFFSMKLIKGEDLATLLAGRKHPGAERRRFLGIFEHICQTMAYAHARNVIHRDLKPANVMVGAFGEVQVVDWGLAKVLTRDDAKESESPAPESVPETLVRTMRSDSTSSSKSITGSVMGTPAYMPPEQAIGAVERLDQRSDVFALGAILCEILTGKPPYLRKDGDVIQQAATARLAGALERLAGCGADQSMIDLCRRCLGPLPSDRPASAREVADEVTAHLAAVEERAHEAQLAAQAARYRQRTTMLGAAALLVLLILTGGAWFGFARIEQARRDEMSSLVAAARSHTSAAHGKAQAHALDLELWDVAVGSSEKLLDIAQRDHVDPAARDGARELAERIRADREAAAREVARQERDRAMLVRLRDLRLPVDDDVSVANWFSKEQIRLDFAYAAAFASYLDGRSVLGDPMDEVLPRLTSGDIELELATSLDHWALVRDGILDEGGREKLTDAAQTARLRAVAARLDPEHPDRSRLRQLLPEADSRGEDLESFAASVDLQSLGATGCRLLGDALWRARRTDAGLDFLYRSLELHPQSFDLCFQLALHLERSGAREEQLTVLAVARGLQPGHVEVMHRRGIALSELGRHEEAEALFRRLAAKETDNGHYLRHIADELRERGKHDEAIPIYRRSLALAPEEVTTLVNFGLTLLEVDELDESIEVSRRALELSERPMPQCMHNLGLALHKQGEFQEASGWFMRALELPGVDTVKTRYQLGCLLRDQGRHDEAVASLEMALADAPQLDGDATRLAGKDRHEVRAAMAQLHEALAALPQVTEIHAALGLVHGQQGLLDEAVASYRRTLELDPDHVRALTNIARFLIPKGELREAEAHLERALELEPDNLIALNSLATLRERDGDHETADAMLARILEIDPEYGPALYNQAQGLVQKRDLAGAIGAFERAADAFASAGLTDDQSVTFFENSVLNAHALMQMAGRGGDSQKLVEKALAARPDSARLLCLMGEMQLGQNRLAEAVATLQRSIEADPDLARAHSKLGSAYFAGRRTTEAAISFTRALQLEPDGPTSNNLADTWAITGNFAPALEEFRRAEQLFGRGMTSFDMTWKGRVHQRIQELEELLSVAQEIVQGAREPASADELAAAIEVACDTGDFLRAVALTEAALAGEDRGLVTPVQWGLYDSSRAAVLAAADPDLAAAERVRLRSLAHAWLDRELSAWESWATSGGAPEAHARMRTCREEGDFATVRGDALDQLPQKEREPWADVWRRIDRALADEDD